jgi:hypothetical protein
VPECLVEQLLARAMPRPSSAAARGSATTLGTGTGIEPPAPVSTMEYGPVDSAYGGVLASATTTV